MKKQSKVKAITPSAVRDYVISPFMCWCRFFAPEEEKDPMPEYVKLLIERGNKHEQETVSQLYPGLVPIEFETWEEGFQIALDEFVKGVSVINNIPIFYLPENIIGKPDILERSDEHKSVFGNYCYIVKDIKSAKNIDDKHILPTALNNYIIGKIQGYIPHTFYVIDRDKNELPIPFDFYKQPLMNILEDVKEIIDGKTVTPTAGSLSYPWQNFGMKKAIELDDISLIPNIGKSKKQKLCSCGITTIDDMVKVNVSSLNIKGIGTGSLETFKKCAICLKENRVMVLQKQKLPKHETEIYLDFEGTDVFVIDEEEVKIDYLIGLLVAEGNKEEYIPIIAKKLEDEEKVLKAFLKFIKTKKDFVIYHYSYYERTQLKKMFEKYGISMRIWMSIESRMIDLMKLVKNSIILPTYSYSLKEVARYLGFKWTDPNFDAQDSVALFIRYLEDKDEEKLNKIIKYNEDDCRASKIVKEFLTSPTEFVLSE
jgi:uncharacterized protein